LSSFPPDPEVPATVLREATDEDLETIRRWRNHPRVRGSMIYTAFITPEDHARWWAAVQADPGRYVLIFEYEGVPSGVVTINDHDGETGTAEWGFFLDIDGLESRGALLPAWLGLEQAAVDHGFGVLGLASMGGRTLAWNKQVLALHRRFGFVEVPERGYATQVEGTDQDVVWTELTRERLARMADRRARTA
jgi:UDP-4-amino-4,6-dideoxy-N-acetyl-beta-L-altrosamine N-acetyltransferase